MIAKANKLLICVLVIGLILTACASTSSDEGGLPDLGTIKIGYLPVMGYSPFYLGVEKGYFEEQGLTVELERFDSGSKMMAPLSTGQLDVGGGEPGTALFNSVHQDLDVKAVCGFAAQSNGNDGTPTVVRTELFESGEVTEPADLEGKKLGVNVLSGMAEYTFAKLLDEAGLTVDDAELVTLPFPDMPVALANGAIDAAHLPFPLAGRALGDGSVVIFRRGDEIAGDLQNGILYFGKRMLEPENKEVAVRVLVAYLKALRDLHESDWSDEEDVAIISEYTTLPAEVIMNSSRSYYDPNCQFIPESIEDIQEYYVSRGYTEYSEPIPLSDIIDESFLNEALSRIGEYQE